LAPALLSAVAASSVAAAEPLDKATAPNGAPALTSPGAAISSTPPTGHAPLSGIAVHAAAEIRQDDLLLMSVDLDGLSITDALPAYGSASDPLLPLGELARLLDLNVTVSAGDGRITGLIGEAQRALTIDLATGTTRESGRDFQLSPQDVAVTQSEIYFRASALERFLPIKIKADTEALSLNLTAVEKLPIQARLERLSKLREIRPDVESDEPTFNVPTPYSLLTAPSFDITTQVGGASQSPRFPHSFEVRLGGDVLYTGFQGFIGSDENGHVSSVQATFERHDLKGNLLGPLHATSVQVGDVYTPASPIGARSGGGRGFSFSTAPLEQTSVFNRIDLRGDLPIGYDVELYVNDVLRSGQRTPVQGRYEFLNVPLVRGLNVIRIVLNGPHGERTEQTKIVNVGGGQLAKGQITLEAGVVQQDTPLINVQKPQPGDVLGPGVGQLRASANVAYGLTGGITLLGGAATYAPSAKEDRLLLTTGLRTSLFGAAVQLDAAGDGKGGEGFSLGLAGSPFGISTLARQAIYRNGFVDETIGSGTDGRALTSHTQVDMDFNIHPSKDLLLPLSLHFEDDAYADHSSTVIGGFRGSTSFTNILLSGGLDLTSTSTPGAPISNVTTANVSASTFYAFKWQLRGNLDYNVMPTPQLNDFSLTADRDLNATTALRLGVGESFISRETSLQTAGTFKTHYGDLSLTGNYTVPTGIWQVGMSFAFGLAFDPYANHYIITRPGPATGGNVAFQAYMDTNGDGAYDAGDKPVSGVAIDGGEQKGVTNATGRSFITGLGVAPTSRLQVNLDGIDDPYVQSPPKTIAFSPRPGRVVKVAYPLSASSEVIAHVQLRQPDGKLVGLSAVHVRLTRKGGTPQEASTEFDGTIGFEQLAPGVYDFTLDPEQSERLHMTLKSPKPLVVPAVGGPLPDYYVEVVFAHPAADDSSDAPAAAPATPPQADPAAKPASVAAPPPARPN
jgi:hypothetical protein